MNESFVKSGELSCAEATSLLEKRCAEEPLSTLSAQQLQAHLAACPECSRSVELISSLPARAEAHAERRFNSGLPAAYRAMADKRSQRQRKERRLKIATAAVAAAVLVSLFFGRTLSDRLKESATEEIETAATALPCRPVRPAEPAPGIRTTHCEGEALDTRVVNDGELRVRLTNGTVGLLVDPNRPTKRSVVVETPQGEVRVKGTLFTVHVDGTHNRLEVFRGVVEFVPTASDAAQLSVSAGHGADLAHPRVFALSSPRTDAMRQVLLATAGSRPTPGASDPASNGSISNGQGAQIALESGDPETSAPLPSDEAAPSASDAAHRTGSSVSQKRDVPTIDRLIQEAQACLIARDWTCASSRYKGLLTHYPNRPESTAALVSLARIELTHLGKPTPALEHFQAYRRKAPNGPMAEEALFGIAASYRKLGKADAERETLRRFIDRFPQSSQIRRARSRLLQLDE